MRSDPLIGKGMWPKEYQMISITILSNQHHQKSASEDYWSLGWLAWLGGYRLADRKSEAEEIGWKDNELLDNANHTRKISVFWCGLHLSQEDVIWMTFPQWNTICFVSYTFYLLLADAMDIGNWSWLSLSPFVALPCNVVLPFGPSNAFITITSGYPLL